MIAGAGAYAHWAAALLLALAFLLLVYLVVLVSRQTRDLAELKTKLEPTQDPLREIDERPSPAKTEEPRGIGSTDFGTSGQYRRSDLIATHERPGDLKAAFANAKAEGWQGQAGPPPPPPPPPPPVVAAKTAPQPSSETERRLVAHYNRLVEDVSRDLIDEFKGLWNPVAMKGTEPGSLERSESGALWLVHAVEAGKDYHYVLPGESMFRKWSTMRAGGGHSIKDYLERFYAMEEGKALRLVRAATVYEEGDRFLPHERGRLSGV